MSRLWATAGIAAALLFGTAGSGHSGASGPATFRFAAGPYAGRPMYVSPDSSAARAASPDAPRLQTLAHIPQAIWLTGGRPAAAARAVRAAVSGAAVPVFVIYDVPHRDCAGGHSAGGAATEDEYRAYVSAIAGALHGHDAVVVLEPDSLTQLACLDQAQRDSRTALLRWAVHRLAGVPVYLDGGVRGAQDPRTMAQRLIAAGIADARGFALNVANYDGTADEIGYGREISRHVGWKHFVIDTSRNGVPGRPSRWCNAPGRGVGAPPGSPVADRAVDAVLWIKHPGESDGRCGASRAPAGHFDPDLAIGLMRRGGY